jgi:hypothetical protein
VDLAGVSDLQSIADRLFTPHRVVVTGGAHWGESGTAIEYHAESPPWLLVDLDSGATVPVAVADLMPTPKPDPALFGGYNAAVIDIAGGIVYAQCEIDGTAYDLELPAALFPELERPHIKPGAVFYFPFDDIVFSPDL